MYKSHFQYVYCPRPTSFTRPNHLAVSPRGYPVANVHLSSFPNPIRSPDRQSFYPYLISILDSAFLCHSLHLPSPLSLQLFRFTPLSRQPYIPHPQPFPSSPPALSSQPFLSEELPIHTLEMLRRRSRRQRPLTPLLTRATFPPDADRLPRPLVHARLPVKPARDTVQAVDVGEAFRVADEGLAAEHGLVVLLAVLLRARLVLGDAVDGVLDQLVPGFPGVGQTGVDDDAGQEAEEPVEGVEVLGAGADVGGGGDGLGEAGEIGADGEEEGDGGARVDAPFVVAVAAVRVVEAGHVDVLFFDKPVVRGDDAGHGGEEDGVATHEGEECCGGG